MFDSISMRRNTGFGLSHSRGPLIACGLVAAALIHLGCSGIERRLYEQKLDMARAKRHGLEQAIQYLRANPNPEATASVHAFVANDMINRSLSFIDNTTAVYKEKYLLRLERVRLSSSGGFPVVSVTASASRWGLTARLSVSATALLIVKESDPHVGTLNVHVTEVIPEIHWYDFHLRFAGFSRDLARSELQAQLNAAFPPFDIPLLVGDDVRNDLRLESLRIQPQAEFWEGYIDGKITYPPLDVGADVKVDRILFLEDGIHCFLTFKKREPAQ